MAILYVVSMLIVEIIMQQSKLFSYHFVKACHVPLIAWSHKTFQRYAFIFYRLQWR